MAPYAYTPGSFSTPNTSSASSSSPITPPTLVSEQIELRHSELKLETAELKSKRRNVLLERKIYEAKHSLGKAELKFQRRKEDIEVKRQKQKAEFEIKQRQVVLEAEQRRDDLELKTRSCQ